MKASLAVLFCPDTSLRASARLQGRFDQCAPAAVQVVARKLCRRRAGFPAGRKYIPCRNPRAPQGRTRRCGSSSRFPSVRYHSKGSPTAPHGCAPASIETGGGSGVTMGLAVSDGAAVRQLRRVPARLAGPRRRACRRPAHPHSRQSGPAQPTGRVRGAWAVSHRAARRCLNWRLFRAKAAGQRGAAVLAHGGSTGASA